MKTPECVIENRKRTKIKNVARIREYARERYQSANGRLKVLVNTAKARAEARDIPFSITSDTITIPTVCPVLGIPIKLEDTYTDNVPTIDRIVPTLGYVFGNVAVISNRANRLKSDATAEELRQIADWMDSHGIS